MSVCVSVRRLQITLFQPRILFFVGDLRRYMNIFISTDFRDLYNNGKYFFQPTSHYFSFRNVIFWLISIVYRLKENRNMVQMEKVEVLL